MNHCTVIRELSETDRPYEKCIAHGTQALSDAELLAVILRSGVRGASCVDLAREILALQTGEDGLHGMLRLSLPQLMQIKGVGKVKAVQIRAIAELSKRIAMQSRRKKLVFDNPMTIADYYMEELRHEQKEKLLCVMLDTKNHFLGDTVLTVGTVNSSLVSIRELFLEALKFHAVHIILLHNHPSGDPRPSKEDILVTKKIHQAGELIGVTLLDHIIIGDNCYEALFRNGQPREK